MNKFKKYTIIVALGLSALTGCAGGKTTKSMAVAAIDEPVIEDEKCWHENTDESGICLDCGEEAGVIIGKDEFYAYFDILMQPKRGYTDGYDIVIAPRSGYENATFENVCVTIYGTKLANDGFSKTRDCALASIFLDEKGTGSYSGFINNFISADYIEVGPCFIGAARVHLNGCTPEGTDPYQDTYGDSENSEPEEIVIKEDEFYKYFDMVDTGLHVEISPNGNYMGYKFTDCQAIIQGYLGTQFKDLGYVDINERGFGRAQWYGLSDEEQSKMQIEKIYINPLTVDEKVPMIHLDDHVSDVEAWIPKTEEISIGKYDFDKYFDLTPAMENDPENGYYLFTITPKDEYKYCDFYNVEVTLSCNTDDGIMPQTYSYGPLKLKHDGTEYIEWRINYVTEFTGIEMGERGKIRLK